MPLSELKLVEALPPPIIYGQQVIDSPTQITFPSGRTSLVPVGDYVICSGDPASPTVNYVMTQESFEAQSQLVAIP